MTTLEEAFERASKALKPASETHRLDAQVLLAHALKKPLSWILSHSEHVLEPAAENKFERMLGEVKGGIPLPYVIGFWEFYGLEFQLTQDVLIPRPETELLVERAIGWLNLHPGQRLTADVGTGSGCIAITSAFHVRDLTVLASDISLPALRLARANAVRHAVDQRVHFLQADLLPETRRKFDLICANLPYIPSDDLKRLDVYGREPTLALDGGRNGLTFIQKLLEEGQDAIARGGCLLLEIEASQGRSAKEAAEWLYPGGEIRVLKDLAGRERLLQINMIK